MTTVSEVVARAMERHRRGDLAEAEAGYREALRLEPNQPDALHLLGVIIGHNGDPIQGAALIERAVSFMPSSVEAHINLATLFARLSRFAEAEAHFRTAEEFRPGNAEVANGIGGCALRGGRYDEAETWFIEAIKRNPNCASALVNMGSLMEALGRRDDTLPYYDRALVANPDYPEAHQYKALALLTRGRLAEGWREYEWRFKSTAFFKGRFAFPYWRGEPLSGRKILVWTEQGLGEEILTLGMIPDLLAAGARVVLICSPRLTGLVMRSFPEIETIPVGGRPAHEGVMADIAFQASMSDLGLQLRAAREAFPKRKSYLASDPNLARALRERYQQDTDSPLVGISWRSKSEESGEEKSIALEHWEGVLRTPDVTFVNLQYGDVRSEVAAAEQKFGVRMVTDPDVTPLGDMDPFASQVAAMDLILTVSNTTAHVAGAIGAMAWTLVPANTGRLWYWFLEERESLWYPNIRLFRQQGRSWEPTLKEVASELALRAPFRGAR